MRRATIAYILTPFNITQFLSTLSLRRATFRPHRECASKRLFLSTLSLRRATNAAIGKFGKPRISIHALLAESDGALKHVHQKEEISIHALLAESDPQHKCCGHRSNYFYPRSPCGERQRIHAIARHCTNFYPRSPCGERLEDSTKLTVS